MAVYVDPSAPAGVTITRGIEFVNGRTADIQVSSDTRALFTAMGIREEPTKSAPKADIPKPKK